MTSPRHRARLCHKPAEVQRPSEAALCVYLLTIQPRKDPYCLGGEKKAAVSLEHGCFIWKGLSGFESLFLSSSTCGGTWGSSKGANCSCTIKYWGVSRPLRSPGQHSPNKETVALLIRALTFTWLLFNTHSTLPQTPIQNIDISADRLGQILE